MNVIRCTSFALCRIHTAHACKWWRNWIQVKKEKCLKPLVVYWMRTAASQSHIWLPQTLVRIRSSVYTKQVVGKFWNDTSSYIDTKVRSAELIYNYDWSSVPQANISTIPSFFVFVFHSRLAYFVCYGMFFFFSFCISCNVVYVVFVIGMKRRQNIDFYVDSVCRFMLSHSTAMKGSIGSFPFLEVCPFMYMWNGVHSFIHIIPPLARSFV